MSISCLIIEDEDHAADFLEAKLRQIKPNVNILAKIDTVNESVKWLIENKADLIFMDIELGDGLCFEIFDHVQVDTPIIFVTSYNQYAIKSFEQNSLGYILKPTKAEDLERVINKYLRLYEKKDFNMALKEIVGNSYQQKFIVHIGNVYQSLVEQQIAYFRLQEKRYLIVCSSNGEQFLYDSSLERLEERLNPEVFFRINRQFIVNRQMIDRVQQLDRGRFLLHTTPSSKIELVVSSGRSKEFKDWYSV